MQKILVGLLALILIPLSFSTVAAAPSHPVWGSFVNASGVPAGSTIILNINYKVTSDEDSGFVGYWALDNYNHQVQVWQMPNGTFYAVARYEGTWTTFTGALSPQSGTQETVSATGTFEGGYVAIFTGTFTPGSMKTNGNIGTFSFGGSESDILLGTYGAGQTGPTSAVSYLTLYFTGVSNFAQPQWGWTYHFQSQTWNNYYYGSSGDIVA